MTLVTAWPVVLDDGALSERFYAYRCRPPRMSGGGPTNSCGPRWAAPTRWRSSRPTPRPWLRIWRMGRLLGSRAQSRTTAPGTTYYRHRARSASWGAAAPCKTASWQASGTAGGILEPATLGPVLVGEIARYQKIIADLNRGTKSSLEQLEASMTPEAKAERRAKRAERWKTQFRNPATLASELDAADRSDEADYQRQKERLTPPAVRDPKSVYGAPAWHSKPSSNGWRPSTMRDAGAAPAAGWIRRSAHRTARGSSRPPPGAPAACRSCGFAGTWWT